MEVYYKGEAKEWQFNKIYNQILLTREAMRLDIAKNSGIMIECW